MKPSTVDTWIWVLIYGGSLVIGLGLSVQRENSTLGIGIAIAGGVITAIGITLIYVRSRMNDSMKDDTP